MIGVGSAGVWLGHDKGKWNKKYTLLFFNHLLMIKKLKFSHYIFTLNQTRL